MDHAALELTGIAFVALAATIFGMIMVRLRQPAILGYIFAGAILGGGGLGIVTDRESIGLLAELGVVLLLYFIGMELSLRSFRQVWRIAVITAGVQIALSMIVVFGLAESFGFSDGEALLFAFSLAISSTAVAVKVLEDIGELRTRIGRITIGILIAQDLAVAPMLIILHDFKGSGFDITILIKLLLAIAILLVVIIAMTRARKISMPFRQLWVDKSDLAPLMALTWCFVFAGFFGLIGISPAFGAFLAGLVVGNSSERQIVHNNAGPVQAILLMIFFLSVGLLVDFGFILENLFLVLFFWVFVVVAKSMLNMLLLRLQGLSMADSFMIGLTLGQLGEFTFVMAAVAIDVQIIDTLTHKLLIAVTVLTLVSTPINIDIVRRLSHPAARRAGNFTKVFRLIYFRERRVTVLVSRFIGSGMLAILDSIDQYLSKATNRTRRAKQKFRTSTDQTISPDVPTAPSYAPDFTQGLHDDAPPQEKTEKPRDQHATKPQPPEKSELAAILDEDDEEDKR
ncbi:MAG: cation:proton antiporter [Pseudomonadota bacterium]